MPRVSKYQRRIDEGIDPKLVKKAKAEEATRKREIAGALVGPEEIENLAKKLHPRRFSDMSGKMAAIVAYLLGQKWTSPQIEDIVVSSDGFVMAQREGEIGAGSFIGTVSDLERNWENLLEAAGLTFEERTAAERLFTTYISDWRSIEPEED